MSKQATSSKETFKSLSAFAQEQAHLVLAHYLKDGGPVTGANAKELCEEAARNIRAAFAELEGRTSPDQGSGSAPPDEEQDRVMSTEPADTEWMPLDAWSSVSTTAIGAQPPLKQWSAICSTDPDGPVSIVTLYQTPKGFYEVRFSELARDQNLVKLLKTSGPVAYDPWRNTREAQSLFEAGVEVAEFRCTVANMSVPMQVTRDLVLAGLLRHDGHPILTDHVMKVLDCCLVTPSLSRTHYPARLRGQRIDGALALIMAVGLVLDASGQRGGAA